MIISIIVPIYNENLIIEKNLLKIFNFFNNDYDFEIIVVNDGSTDDSLNTLRNCSLKNLKILNNHKNFGKGYSVFKGILESKGELVLVTDADLSTPIQEFTNLNKILNQGYDFVIGSRSTSNSKIKIKQNPLRIFMGKSFNFLVKNLLYLKYNDTQCGFKLFTGNTIRKIAKKCKVKSFCFDVEILFIAKKLNLRVHELGVEWADDARSSVSVISDSYLMIIDLIKIRFRKYNIKKFD